MGRGAWWATVHGVTELDATKWLTHTVCGILGLGSGIKPTSLALAGGFFTTEPLGKSVVFFLEEEEDLCASVHGIFQARILEWVAISFSDGFFPTQGLNLSLLCLLHCRWNLFLRASGEASFLTRSQVRSILYLKTHQWYPVFLIKPVSTRPYMICLSLLFLWTSSLLPFSYIRTDLGLSKMSMVLWWCTAMEWEGEGRGWRSLAKLLMGLFHHCSSL